MATKEKNVRLRIQSQYCASEIENALNKVGKYNGFDPKQGLFFGSYKYVFQKVGVGIYLKGDKGESLLKVVGETDDLIGAGANKAIKKIVEYLKEVEPQYKIDYEIDDAFSVILKKEYSKGKEILEKVFSQRPDVFKVLFGLGLCYINENKLAKGEEYILKAVSKFPKGEKQILIIRKVTSVLWTLKQYQIASKLFKQIGEKDKAEEKDKLFYMLLLLNSKKYSELVIVLLKEFPKNKNFVLKLLKDRSVENVCRKEFIKKLPVLIKVYRKKVVFNILAPSINFLITKKSYKIPQQYRTNVNRFYKSKNIDIIDFINLYNSILELLKNADIEAENILKKESITTFKSIKNNAILINIFNENNSVFPNKKDLHSISEEVENCAIKLSKANGFNNKYNTIQESYSTNMKCETFLKKYKDELPMYINNLLIKKKVKEAEQIIEVFKEIYKTAPPNINDVKRVIDEIKIKKKNKTTKVIKIGIIGFVVIISSVILYSMMFGEITENKTLISAKKNWSFLNEKNFTIQYPSDWELNQSGQMGSSFILFSQLTERNDQFKENVNLIIQDLTGYNMSLDQYVEVSEGQIKTNITDGNIISSTRENRNGMQFQKVIYTGKQGILYLKFEQYYWVYNNHAYVLTLTCEIDQFDYFKTMGERVLESFQIIKN